MSIVLVDRGGRLAQVQEGVLRLNFNRENREFFYRAAGLPLAEWPVYRDDQIAKILDSLEWFPIWDAPDGEHTIRQGMGKTVARKRGDLAVLLHISARGKAYKEESWYRGQTCPSALTPQMIAERWDESVFESRMRRIDEVCPEDCVATWHPNVQKAARACRSLAADGKWRKALEQAEIYPRWLPYTYLLSLVEGR